MQIFDANQSKPESFCKAEKGQKLTELTNYQKTKFVYLLEEEKVGTLSLGDSSSKRQISTLF